jgi:hypothetical protein
MGCSSADTLHRGTGERLEKEFIGALELDGHTN